METKIKDRLTFDKETGVCQTAGAPKAVAVFWSNKHQELCWDDVTKLLEALEQFGCDTDPDLINEILVNKYANAVQYECGTIRSTYDMAELVGYGDPYDDSYWYGILQYMEADVIDCILKEHDILKIKEATSNV